MSVKIKGTKQIKVKKQKKGLGIELNRTRLSVPFQKYKNNVFCM